MRKTLIVSTFVILLAGSAALSNLDVWFPRQINYISNGFTSPADWISGRDRLERLDILGRVLAYTQERYVDPARVDASAMLKAVLERLSRSIAEVRVVYPSAQRTVLMVDEARLEMDSKVPNLSALRSVVADALKFIRSHKKSEISDQDMETAAIDAVLSTLDPHSTFLTSDMFKETKVGTSGKFGGVGIVIGLRNSKLTIISPLDDTPAFRAGLKAGDYITKINDESTVNMTLTEAVDKMRGPKGVPVTLAVVREGWTIDRSFTLIRDIIEIVSVESDSLSDGIGYVKVKNFQGNTAKELAKHLRKLTKEAGGKLRGVVLDLRNNPGGLLDQAIAVSDKFLESGPIVSTVGHANRLRDQENATAPDTEPNYPLIVLVNEGSASASEIVAGAFKRRDRALIIGQRTFGKGTVQSLYDLPENSGLKLTVAQYLTPGDYSIQSIGIVPDLKLIPAIITKSRFSLFPKEHPFGEENLDRHIDRPGSKEKDSASSLEIRYFDALVEDEPSDDEIKPLPPTLTTPERVAKLMQDFSVFSAHQILKASPFGANRQALVETAKSQVATLQDREEKKIAQRLSTFGIQWTKAPRTGSLKCAPPIAELKLPGSSESPVKAGEKVIFSVTLHNTGKCTLYQARAITISKNFLFAEREFLFGKVDPGQKVTRDVTVDIPKSMPSTPVEVSLNFGEAQGSKLKDQVSAITSIRALSPPRFSFRLSIADLPAAAATAKANGLLERGEAVEMKVTVKNVGELPFGDATVALHNPGQDGIFLRAGRYDLKGLKPGEEKEGTLSFEIRPTFNEPKFSLELQLMDSTYRIFESKKLFFGIDSPTAVKKKMPLRVSVQKNSADILLLPFDQSLKLASAPAGSVLSVTGGQGLFYRVRSSSTTEGWISSLEAEVSDAKEASGPVVITWYEPPRLAANIAALTARPMNERVVPLKGELEDNQTLKDLLIFVNEKKVFYKGFASKNSKNAKESFETTLPLEAGVNRVLLVARDGDDLAEKVSFLVLRPGGETQSDDLIFGSDPTLP